MNINTILDKVLADQPLTKEEKEFLKKFCDWCDNAYRFFRMC